MVGEFELKMEQGGEGGEALYGEKMNDIYGSVLRQ